MAAQDRAKAAWSLTASQLQSPQTFHALRGVVVEIATSRYGDRVYARTSDGKVFSWGHGKDGLLGHGDEKDQLVPKEILFTGL